MIERILECVDAQPDGIATFQQLCGVTGATPNNLLYTLEELITEGVLQRRDCYAYAVERVGNTRSSYGIQTNFDFRIHLNRREYNAWLNDSASGNGLRMLVFDSKQCCVNTLHVANREDGDVYFRKWYDVKCYSHDYCCE